MTKNKETPATGMARALRNVDLQADIFEIAPPRSEIQKNHLRQRFGLTDAAARTIAELAFASPESWRARA